MIILQNIHCKHSSKHFKKPKPTKQNPQQRTTTKNVLCGGKNKKMKNNKKGQVAGIAGAFYALMFAAVAIVVVVIIQAFGADFVTTQQADFTASGAAYNVTVLGLDAVDTLAQGTGDVTDVGVIYIVLLLLVSLIGVFAGVGYLRGQM